MAALSSKTLNNHPVLCWLLYGFLLLPTALLAQTPDTLNYYYDSSGGMSLESFQENIVNTQQYAPFKSAEIPIGTGDHWAFLRLEQRPNPPQAHWVIEVNFPNIDFVRAYVRYDNGIEQTFTTGDGVPFKQWPVNYRKPSIPLHHIHISPATVYFRVQIESPFIFPMRLVSSHKQTVFQGQENFLYGLFYGAIFILALYNAGVYFSLRDPSYGYYVLYILAFALVQASTTGIGQQYLWPQLANATTKIALLAIVLTNVFMLFFVKHFLDLERIGKTQSRIVTATIAWTLLLIPALLLPHYATTQFVIHGTNVLGMLIITATTLSVYRRNPRPATYLLFSYSILFSAICLSLLFQANLIPHHRIVDYSMSAAIVVEAIVLSIGLSDRIYQLRRDNERAERERRIVHEELSQQLITAREKERSDISTQLHDSVNHDLVVVRNKIRRLATNENALGDTAQNELDDIDAMINTSIEEVRSISHRSHPQFVRHLGLETALQSLLEKTFDEAIQWNLYVQDIQLNDDVELLLYRAVQEATTNILKHASASECLVRLDTNPDDGWITLIVKDDGSGFNAKSRSWRFGLRTLNAHCQSLGGKLTMRSEAHQGTTLQINLPPEAVRSRDRHGEHITTR